MAANASKEKHFEDIPTEIVINIFSYLSSEELALSASNVCCRWKEISQVERLWRDSIFEPSRKMRDTDIVHHLKNMPQLKCYVNENITNTKIVIETICEFCVKLTKLRLDASAEVNNHLMTKIVCSLCNISQLSIPLLYNKSNLENAALLGELQNLTDFTFADCKEDAPCGVLLAIGAGCPRLRHMDLGENHFDEHDMEFFFQIKHKELLSFSVNCCILPLAFEALVSLCCFTLENLTYWVRHNFFAIDGNTFMKLRDLRNLKYLSLDHPDYDISKSVPELFENHSLSTVSRLELSLHWFLGNETLMLIHNTPQLTHFSLRNYNEKLEEAFRCIGNWQNLEYLSLSGSFMTNKSLDYVAEGCPKLRCLELMWVGEGCDDLILSVVKCKQLHVLSIKYSRFSGKHFELFPTLPHLKKIDARGCNFIDNSLWEILRIKMPHLKIQIGST